MTDTEAFKALCAEAKDLMKRLEGSSVQRITVEAAGAKIEVERGAAVLTSAEVNGSAAVSAVGSPISAAMAISPGARGASGSFSALGTDNRIPVLAPLVGTYYEAPGPGQKAFVEVGQTV